jgi:PPP family 3-phenylpropionic acid transporter
VLRVFYACYFANVGLAVVFFPPYLRSLGLSGRQIAGMLSLAPVLHVFVPLGWGWVADRTRRPDVLLRLACLAASLLMVPLVFVRAMPALLLCYAAHQSFAVPIGGLADALALERVRQGQDYGRIRLWGSVAFALVSGALGAVLATRERTDGDPLVPAAMASFLFLAFLASLSVRGGGERERPHARDLSALLADRRFLFLLVLAPLHWACAAPYHGFFAILLQDRHLSPTVWGQTFMVSVGSEVAALFLFGRLRRRFGLAPLLAAAFAGTGVRWLLVAVVRAPLALVMLQTAHFLTFGLFWGAALGWLGECVPARLRATGQTLFTGVTYGLGNIAGMFATGALYDASGGAEVAFLSAGLLELLPLGLVLALGRRLDPGRGSGR